MSGLVDGSLTDAEHYVHEDNTSKGGPKMGRLYDIIQAHMDAQPYGTSVRKVAEAMGVSATTIANWREPKDLPHKEHLEAIARVTGTSYDTVFYAAGVDAGYIVETVIEPEPESETG